MPTKIIGKITRKTEKAIRLKFKNYTLEMWIPKRHIAKVPKPNFNSEEVQAFGVRTSFLKRKLRGNIKTTENQTNLSKFLKKVR